MVARSESRMSSLGLRILAFLEDGEWHDMEDVIYGVQYTIPPGEAFRAGEKVSNATVRTRSNDEIMESGRRSLTVTMVNNLVSNGRVEKVGGKSRTATKMVRLKEKVPQIFVVRDQYGNLSVFPHTDITLAVHVLDAMAPEPDNPEESALAVKQIFDSLPFRMTGKEEVQQVCRYLMNRHNIAAALRAVMDDSGFGDAKPDLIGEPQPSRTPGLIGTPHHDDTTSDPGPTYPNGGTEQ